MSALGLIAIGASIAALTGIGAALAMGMATGKARWRLWRASRRPRALFSRT